MSHHYRRAPVRAEPGSPLAITPKNVIYVSPNGYQDTLKWTKECFGQGQHEAQLSEIQKWAVKDTKMLLLTLHWVAEAIAEKSDATADERRIMRWCESKRYQCV